MLGKIIKGIAGFYYVDTGGPGVYECRAKGLFRKEQLKPLVGDRVRIAVTHEGDKEANIEEIFPRTNSLYRPAVANIDQAIVVMALSRPSPDLYVLDRFLIQMEAADIPVMIVFNKSDIDDEKLAGSFSTIYKSAGYATYVISVKCRSHLEDVRKLLTGKTTALAGPSGVGKSSLVNYLAHGEVMQTGDISDKLHRGKNTTRHTQLLSIGDSSFICDTPGFTAFDALGINKESLQDCFPEMRGLGGHCRFALCTHINEPDCAVKDKVQSGAISRERYASYVRIFNELAEKEKNKYK